MYNGEGKNGGDFRETKSFIIESAGLSEARPDNTGRKNQDNFLEYNNDKLYMAVVSDGIGGLPGGAEASQLVVDGSKDAAENSTDRQSNSGILTLAIRLADNKIQRAQQLYPKHGGMGATFAGIVIRNGEFACANIGDTRIYRKRGQTWDCFSEDHTREKKLLKQGVPAKQAAMERGVITQAVGYGDDQMDPHYHKLPIYGDEIFLIVSDGVHGRLTDEELFALIDEKDSAETIARKIMDAVKAKELDDDATVTVVKVK